MEAALNFQLNMQIISTEKKPHPYSFAFNLWNPECFWDVGRRNDGIFYSVEAINPGGMLESQNVD